MNVGLGTWDSVQLKTVMPLKRSWVFNLRPEWRTVSWLEWPFGACGLQSSDFVSLTHLLAGNAKGAEACHNCHTEEWEKTWWRVLLHSKIWAWNWVLGSPLLTPPSSKRFSSPFPCFPNSVLTWRCHCLCRRYFSSASLALLLKSFPLNLTLICFVVN